MIKFTKSQFKSRCSDTFCKIDVGDPILFKVDNLGKKVYCKTSPTYIKELKAQKEKEALKHQFNKLYPKK